MATYFEQVAAERGYPGALFGLTPDDEAYWCEPDLNWVGAQLDQHGPTSLDPLLIGPFLVWCDDMAPRFLSGTTLAGQRLTGGDAVVVGQVLAWYAPGTPAGCFLLARVQAVEAGHLLLCTDNSGDKHQLAWGPGAAPERVYLITHYHTQPFHLMRVRLDEVPAPTSEDHLLEIADNQMGPRYPVGARYRCQPVPREGWATARGVHALALVDGKQLLRRILDHHEGMLTLATDRTGAVQQLPLGQVVTLWKLTLADYMPAETEAEHLAIIQRRAC